MIINKIIKNRLKHLKAEKKTYNQEQSSLRLYKNLYPKRKYGVLNNDNRLPSIDEIRKEKKKEKF